MPKIAKQSMVFFLIAALVFIPFTSSALARSKKLTEENSAGAMAVDLLVVRPVGVVSLVIGSALFVVALPFSLLGGNTGESAKKLVAEPAKFTFNRPLGEF
jgi:hypothetical protein